MKKALSLALAFVLALSVFAGVTVFADDFKYEYPPKCLVFTSFAYEVGKNASDIGNGIRVNSKAEDWASLSDWTFMFKKVTAHLELDGEVVTGLIEAGKAYILVVEMTNYLPGDYYGYTDLPKEKLTLFSDAPGSRSAFEYSIGDEVCVAKFELAPLVAVHTYIELDQVGYCLGAEPEDVVVESNTDGIEAITATVYYKKEDGKWGLYRDDKIESGVEYALIIELVTTDNANIAYDSNVSLYGIGDKPIVINGLSSYSSQVGEVYMAFFPLPAAKEAEKLAGDMDGDGKCTVIDALAVLRIAAGLDAPLMTKSTASEKLGDFDGDGVVTVSDALAVLRIAAKLA